ncbi:alanine/glycine:cation symporter family protein [Paenibacillus lactis]|uniref:Amino acid carrier protein n=1 Tax=Paenibacillus lactis 154 TaxID=743719 RepID=G4HMW7_9BACL|nr:alanine/glycine:cation symporter family protein [Paenibacillus lactis]EHB54332.1 amino acid carrier protein [Paenibacillus lactis 154]
MELFIQHAVDIINDFLWSKLLIVLLIAGGLYFTFGTKFLQFRLLGEMFRVIREAKPKAKGSISPFQAFAISMAARVGTGNITGVAIAISLGGPGAVFWMWVIAVIGSASSFIESTLAQIYKIKDGAGGFRGGPAYYIQQGLKKRWMGALFAVLITLSFGLVFNAVQSNTITIAFENSFGSNRLTVGLVMAAIFAVIIFGGVKRIAKMSELIVVVLAVLYVGAALYIILANITKLPEVLTLIVKGAFGYEQIAGGTLGAALMNGIKRGLFSNEAGMGSAPNAAATATTSHPAKQGLVQSLGVLIDTLVICTSTAFIILFTGAYKQTGLDGVALTQAALGMEMGAWASDFLAIMIFLFAFSTLLGNYYYGETNIEFLKSNRAWIWLYRACVLAMVIFGSVTSVKLVWDLADLFMGLMAIVNLIAITLLSKVAFAALKDYLKQRREGLDPVFTKASIKGLEDVECWDGKPGSP